MDKHENDIQTVVEFLQRNPFNPYFRGDNHVEFTFQEDGYDEEQHGMFLAEGDCIQLRLLVDRMPPSEYRSDLCLLLSRLAFGWKNGGLCYDAQMEEFHATASSIYEEGELTDHHIAGLFAVGFFLKEKIVESIHGFEIYAAAEAEEKELGSWN